MDKKSKIDREIHNLSKFVSEIQDTTKGDELYDIPYMIKYQLSEEISSAYEIYDDNILEGIGN